MDSLIAHLSTTYGPIGFGLIAVLVIWGKIMKPELDAQRASVKQATAGSFATKATAETLERTVGELRDCIELLDCPRRKGLSLPAQPRIHGAEPRLTPPPAPPAPPTPFGD